MSRSKAGIDPVDPVTAVKRWMYLGDGYGPWTIKLNIPPSKGLWCVGCWGLPLAMDGLCKVYKTHTYTYTYRQIHALTVYVYAK